MNHSAIVGLLSVLESWKNRRFLDTLVRFFVRAPFWLSSVRHAPYSVDTRSTNFMRARRVFSAGEYGFGGGSPSGDGCGRMSYCSVEQRNL